MYAIVTDTMAERYYLAWRKPYNRDGGYFWTTKKQFDECIDRGRNTEEHRFAFRSHSQAMDAMLKLELPKSWESHVVKI